MGLKPSEINEERNWIQKYLESRNTQYLGKLYERYKQRIFLQCLKMVKNQEEAKDLTSETFLKAFDHIHDFKLDSPFLPWLSRIALNLCIDHLRKRSRNRFEPISEHHAVEYSQNGPIEMESSHASRIINAIQKLKKPQRKCFCLFYINGLSYKEIAELTGYSYDQVRSHIQNGRRRFKILMEQL